MDFDVSMAGADDTYLCGECMVIKGEFWSNYIKAVVGIERLGIRLMAGLW